MTVLAAFSLLAFVDQEASANPRAWQAAGAGAVAILPVPDKAYGIVGASLACAEQNWTLVLRTGRDWRRGLRTGGATPVAETGTAQLGIGRTTFAMPASHQGGTIALALPYEAIAPLQAATTLALEVGGAAGPASAQFSLTGSKRVLDALLPACSPRRMEGYDLVAFAPVGEAVAAAREALKDDIAAFKLATASEPRLQASRVFLDSKRSLLFTQLCGSSWYFGRSGCNVSAFASDGTTPLTRLVYENEGSTTYLDRTATSDGWPAITSVPLKGKPELTTFRWNDERYGVEPSLLAQE
ncbi:MAG TPA: hypothetical protein VGN98_03405 [Tianweitania sediminis]|nr:hypothetical protein [Tianweitania sediminis]